MSRATIIIALARVLNRQPTREEYETMCRELGEGCVVYVPKTWPVMQEQAPEVQKLRGEGMSVRHISRMTRLSKSAVHRILSQNCLCLVDTETV
jgi:reverse gyrase